MSRCKLPIVNLSGESVMHGHCDELVRCDKLVQSAKPADNLAYSLPQLLSALVIGGS